MAITKRIPKGSPLTAAEMDSNLTILENVSSSVNTIHSTLQTVSSSVSNLSSISGQLSGQFTGSVLISGSLSFQNIDTDNASNEVLVYNSTTKVIGKANVSIASGTNGSGGTSGTSGTSGVSGDRFASTSSTLIALSTGAKTLTIGSGLQWQAGQGIRIAYDGSNYMEGTVTSYSGTTLIVNITSVTGSGGPYSSWTINTLGAAGQAGTHGTSGTSGIDGTSGTSGANGTSGTSGINGTSGTSGVNGSNGTSGTSGINGTFFGTSGTSGISGSSGTSGVNGTNGTGGTSGTSGVNGTNGTGGTSGTSGTAGTSGTSGVSSAAFPYTGSAVISGSLRVTGSANFSTNVIINGALSLNGGATLAGNSTFFLGTNSYLFEDSQTGNTIIEVTNNKSLALQSKVEITGSLAISQTLTASLAQGYVWVGGPNNVTRLVATSSFGGASAASGIFIQTGSFYATTNNLQITGSVDINGPLTASLPQGYMWVGGLNNKPSLLATASFTASNAISASFGRIAVQQGTNSPISGVSRIVFSGAGVSDDGSGQVTVSFAGGGGGSLTFVTGSTTYASITQVNAGAGVTLTQPSPNQVTLGVSGVAGASGSSGTSGTSGVNGTGAPGAAGTSGTSGTSGRDGSIGTDGTGGTSGTSGTSGVSGLPGTSGTSGTSGQNGSMGTSGTSGTSGIGANVIVRDTGITAIANVQDLVFSGSFTLTPSGSGAIIGISNVNVAGAPQGTVSGSAQIAEYGGALTYANNSFSVQQNFTTGSLTKRWLVTKDASANYVFAANRASDGSGNDITIYANVGDTLIFEVTSSGQPFWLKTSNLTGTGNGITGVSNNGTQQGIVQWITTGSAATTYYYISENTSNMQGEIRLVHPTTATRIFGGNVQLTGSLDIVGGGINVVSGGIYINGVAVGSGGGSGAGGIFIATGSVYNTTNNVGITGSLVVSGSITASAITVTSPGSPEIYSANNLYLNAANVVAITSSSLRLANFISAQTSSFIPQAGDVYYNTDRHKFMGYVSSSWIEFTSGAMVSTPTISGNKVNGLVTYQSATSISSEPSMSFNNGILDITGSAHITSMLRLVPMATLPATPAGAGYLAVSSSNNLFYYNGAVWTQLN